MSTLSQFFGNRGSSEIVPIEVCLIGGGGGGGCDTTNSPGGGAGQVRYLLLNVNKGIQYDIIIGAGGRGGSVNHEPNTPLNGEPTYFGSYFADGGNGYGQPTTFGSTAGALPGVTPPSVVFNSSQSADGFSLQRSGNVGFFGTEYEVSTSDPDGPIGGGGGGAGGPSPIKKLLDFNEFQGTSGDGHLGINLSFIGYPTLRVAGGGGGAGSSTNNSSRGSGVDGGGSGGSRNNPAGNGTANTGGGGGGGNRSTTYPVPSLLGGGKGGSGLVIIRYPDDYPAATVNNNATTPAQSGFRVYRWNASGSIIFN
jgi:hypothetical protein